MSLHPLFPKPEDARNAGAVAPDTTARMKELLAGYANRRPMPERARPNVNQLLSAEAALVKRPAQFTNDEAA